MQDYSRIWSPGQLPQLRHPFYTRWILCEYMYTGGWGCGHSMVAADAEIAAQTSLLYRCRTAPVSQKQSLPPYCPVMLEPWQIWFSIMRGSVSILPQAVELCYSVAEQGYILAPGCSKTTSMTQPHKLKCKPRAVLPLHPAFEVCTQSIKAFSVNKFVVNTNI